LTRFGKNHSKIPLIGWLAQTLGLALVLIGCGTGPQPISIAGNWTGTLTDSFGRPGTATLYLTDDMHDVLHGTFSYSASNCSADLKPVIGKMVTMQMSLSQVPPDPVTTSLELTVDSTDQLLKGTYGDASGVCDSSGAISLTKE
jgi:hypothetical protein